MTSQSLLFVWLAAKEHRHKHKARRLFFVSLFSFSPPLSITRIIRAPPGGSNMWLEPLVTQETPSPEAVPLRCL